MRQTHRERALRLPVYREFQAANRVSTILMIFGLESRGLGITVLTVLGISRNFFLEGILADFLRETFFFVLVY